jgi:hypothetical protein
MCVVSAFGGWNLQDESGGDAATNYFGVCVEPPRAGSSHWHTRHPLTMGVGGSL